MNTKDHILAASLTLMNEEGETSVSSVDIANYLDISPGNLYYHFKGKDEIIPALFDLFEQEMQIILRSSPQDLTSIEDQWIVSYIVLEEIWDFRFFYRNLDGILSKYPVLVPRFKRLLMAKRRTIHDNIDQLVKLGVLHIEYLLKDNLVEQILLIYTYWLNLRHLEDNSVSAKTAIHQSVFQIMTLCVPYMGANGHAALKGMKRLLHANTAPK